MKALLAAFARNTVFANIALILIFMAGGLGIKNMTRETFPEFSIDMIAVSVPYPGADPEEVEEGINRKIEEVIEGIEGIQQFTTRSSEGFASINIEIQENFDVNEVLDLVRNKIEAIATFPEDAEKPTITAITLKEAVVVLYLSGTMSERGLKEWAHRLEDQIQLLPEISHANVSGIRDYEISAAVSEARLRQYGITFEQVTAAIRRSNLNLPGGTVRTKGEEIRVRTIGRRYTGEEFAKIVVLAGPHGEIITLDQIAVIKDGFIQDSVVTIVNGQPAVLLEVLKTSKQDALVISNAVHKFVKSKQSQLPPGAQIGILYETSGMLRARINLLVNNGMIGFILVLILLWLFLDLRLSLWAGMGIPISLCGGLAILWSIGGTINMVSLFGFIMVLGIVVDDAIVVGEAIFHHRREGASALEAAIKGVTEVGMPVIAAVTTTIVTFLPLAFIGGVMGKFIAILPKVVIACLGISLVECLFLLPAHLSHLPGPEAKQNKSANNFIIRLRQLPAHALTKFINHWYVPFLKISLQWRYLSFCTAICILLLTLGLMQGGIIKFEVFPEIDGYVITSNVRFPNGTPLDTTRRALERLDAALMQVAAQTTTRSGDDLVNNRLVLAGRSLGEMAEIGSHVGGMIVTLLESEKRGFHSKDLMVAWEKATGKIPGVESLTFEGMKAGPPGAPIEIWIQGTRMKTILAAQDDLLEQLKCFDGVYQIRSDFSPGKNELRLNLKPAAHSLGLSLSDVARQVRAGYYGAEAVRLQRGRDDIRVKVRYTAKERTRISDLERIRIRTLDGREIPLRSVASIEYAPGYATITRTNGMRRVTVSAAVDTTRTNANEIMTELKQGYFKELMHKYPHIYISMQGEKKKMRESFDSLQIGFPLAIIGIFIIVATMFRSYIQPFVIMFTIPFGIIGAVAGHLIFGYNLSMMSIFGIVALTGVVLNDAIVLIERVNGNLSQQMHFFEALLNAGQRRFRAIFLTTISTVGGLSPLIMEKDMQARFLIPMALSIAVGVLFATLLTLVLIPSLLVILNDCRRVLHWLCYGVFPTREAVEPARKR